MTLPPLPIAPAPVTGEALLSWVARIAARYHLSGTAILAHALGELPHPRHTAVLSAANAGRLPAAEAALAVVGHSCPGQVHALTTRGLLPGVPPVWERPAVMWCPGCLRAALADAGEVHLRASWFVGCCVVCPTHWLPLEDGLAPGCCLWPDLDFVAERGRLRLLCRSCHSLVDARPVEHPWPERWPRHPPARGTPMDVSLQVAPAALRRVLALQEALWRALAGQTGSFWAGLLPTDLRVIVEDLVPLLPRVFGWRSSQDTIAAVWSDGAIPGVIAPPLDHMTLARLPASLAFTVMVCLAAVLSSVFATPVAGVAWDDGTAVSARTLWQLLSVADQDRLLESASQWRPDLRAALWEAIVLPEEALLARPEVQ
ncbi:conserved protein of unknown function (plasmid) [Rhodovastum atsumiense]|nr:conserved protein of unknown function [Rhodovastum atsumiense]